VRIRDILRVDTAAILLIDDETDELMARAAKGLEEEVKRGVRIPIGMGFAGRIAAERLPISLPDVDHADIMNPILREAGVRSMLGVPLIVEAKLLGVLHVGTLEPRVFTEEDAALLELAAARAAPAIERAHVFDALEREHRAGVALQRSLLPERLPEVFGVPVAARYLPARDEVGGDWYDVIELPNGHLGIAIGDVVGHGVRGATLMGQLRTSLRAYALEGYGPGRALERLNRLLQSIRGRGMATASFVVLDPESGRFRFSSAGHPPPLVISPSGSARYLDMETGAPLGALSHVTYSEHEETLEEGEIILLYTDGLVEVRGQSLDVGLDALLEAARRAPSPEEACRQIVHALIPVEGAADDVALVAVHNAIVPTELTLRLPASPPVLARVRQAVRRWLRAHDVPSEEIDLLTLACGEACANAIEHAPSPSPSSFELEFHADGGVITIAVRDQGKWRRPRGDNRGRGLTIIDTVMDEIEVKPTPLGTEVVMRRDLSKRKL
jgi:anti-sigma regulatory factor (Ser/Thr protein kinase)/putative methionine-R-sulfoxide reductase with GAF domain